MKIDIICAIASGQPVSIIIPFLSGEIDCKHLVLLVFPTVKAAQKHLNIKQVLQTSGVKVEFVDLP